MAASRHWAYWSLDAFSYGRSVRPGARLADTPVLRTTHAGRPHIADNHGQLVEGNLPYCAGFLESSGWELVPGSIIVCPRRNCYLRALFRKKDDA